MDFKEWLKEIEESGVVFGSSEKKRDLGDDCFVMGAPGVQHGRSLGPIKGKKHKKHKK